MMILYGKRHCEAELTSGYFASSSLASFLQPESIDSWRQGLRGRFFAVLGTDESLLGALRTAEGSAAHDCISSQIQIIDARDARVELRTCEERCGTPLLERDRQQKN